MLHNYNDVKIDGLMQDCSNSTALAMEFLQSCTKSSKCTFELKKYELSNDNPTDNLRGRKMSAVVKLTMF